jgi:hypothetical protein
MLAKSAKRPNRFENFIVISGCQTVFPHVKTACYVSFSALFAFFFVIPGDDSTSVIALSLSSLNHSNYDPLDQ